MRKGWHHGASGYLSKRHERTPPLIPKSRRSAGLSGSIRELLHDGCPVVCLGDAPFGYVNVFTSHVNVGFFHGAALPDPARLLQGTGKFMRHVKLIPGTATNATALSRLINTAYSDIKARVENG